MALSFDVASDSTQFSDVNTKSWSHTVGASADMLIVLLGLLTTATSVTFAATWNGGAMNVFSGNPAKVSSTFSNWNVLLWLAAPTTGTNTIVITPTGGNMWGRAGATSWIGAHQTTPIIGLTTTSSTSSVASDTISFSSTSGRFVCDVVSGGNNNVQGTVNGNQTVDFRTSASGFIGGAQHVASTGGSVSMTQTFTGSMGFQHSAFEVQPPSGAAATRPVKMAGEWGGYAGTGGGFAGRSRHGLHIPSRMGDQRIAA